MTVTTKEQRRQHIAAMRASSALEDMHPDIESLALQERYVEGTASLDDLLNDARRCAKEQKARQNAVEFARASIALEGFTPSQMTDAEARQLVSGEISLANFVQKEFNNPDDA